MAALKSCFVAMVRVGHDVALCSPTWRESGIIFTTGIKIGMTHTKDKIVLKEQEIDRTLHFIRHKILLAPTLPLSSETAMLLQRVRASIPRARALSTSARSLRFLIVEGYSPEGRAELQRGGATIASELYANVLKTVSPMAVTHDVLHPADGPFQAPDLSKYDGVVWTGCRYIPMA